MKIISIKQLKSGKNIYFVTDEFNEYTLTDILKEGEKGILENVKVITTKSGKKYLRTTANVSSEDNLENISITCNDSDYLLFDREYIYLKAVNGQIKKKWEAFSGNPKSTIADQDKKDFGPLPEGEYIVRFDKTKDFSDNKGIWDDLVWIKRTLAWGFVATPLEPSPKNQMYGRGDFYVHGGLTKGTKGCIEINRHNVQFHCFLRLYHRNMKLIVKYPKK